MASTSKLTEAIAQDLREAWQKLIKSEKREEIYCFGIYTTELGDYLIPTACGEKGLAKVAKRYVKEGHYKSGEALEALRWSLPDSPHHDTFKYDRTEMLLSDRPDPYGLTESQSDREARTRHQAAYTALKTLDKEGLFGKGKMRESITIVLTGPDNADEFALHWLKKLNPKSVYEAFIEPIHQTPTQGTIEQYGSRKSGTSALALSVDGQYIAIAGDTRAFVFETGPPRQVLAKELPKRGAYANLHGVSFSVEGTLAVLTEEGGKPTLSILTGKNWSKVKHFPLQDKEPLSFVGSPTGDWYAMSTQNNWLTVYAPNDEQLARFKAHKDWPRKIAVSPNSRLLASADRRSGLFVWDTLKWEPAIHNAGIKANAVTFNNKGDRMAVYSPWERDPLRIVNPQTGKVLKTYNLEREIQTAAFSPDDTLLALGMNPIEICDPAEAALVDLKAGKIIRSQYGSHSSIDDLAFITSNGTTKIAIAGDPEDKALMALTVWVLD